MQIIITEQKIEAQRLNQVEPQWVSHRLSREEVRCNRAQEELVFRTAGVDKSTATIRRRTPACVAPRHRVVGERARRRRRMRGIGVFFAILTLDYFKTKLQCNNSTLNRVLSFKALVNNCVRFVRRSTNQIIVRPPVVSFRPQLTSWTLLI